MNLDFHFEHHFGSAQKHVLTREEIAAVRVPVLTVHGTKDRNAPYGAGREWALSLPAARLLTVAGAGHHLWVEDAVVLPAILQFLKGGWPEAARKITSLDPSARMEPPRGRGHPSTESNARSE